MAVRHGGLTPINRDFLPDFTGLASAGLERPTCANRLNRYGNGRLEEASHRRLAGGGLRPAGTIREG